MYVKKKVMTEWIQTIIMALTVIGAVAVFIWKGGAYTSEINLRFDRLEERMDKFELRMDKFEQRMDKFEQRMDKFEQRMNEFEQRLNKLTNQVTKIRITLRKR